MPLERLGFGIPDLDKALSGGIPRGNVTLLSGGPGTGKSTFCLHFVLEGVRQGQRAIYISTEQTPEELYRQGEKYGWDLAGYEKQGLLRLAFVDIQKEEPFLETLLSAIRSHQPERIVIDSLTTFSGYAAMMEFARQTAFRQQMAGRVVDLTKLIPQRVSEKAVTRQMLSSLIASLKRTKTTTLMTSELPEKAEYLSSDGISEFLADGVVLLYYWSIGAIDEHALRIRKMRYTTHEKGSILYEFGANGIKIKEGVSL